jgi:outer membrane protein
MKSIFIFLILISLLSISLINPQNNNSKPEVVVGILLDGKWQGDKPALDELILQCNELLSGEFDIKFPENKILSGEWNLNQINFALSNLLEDPEVDIVLAFGEVSSNVAVFRGEFPKPVIAAVAINSELQNMPLRNGTSGVDNLNYISYTASLNNQLPNMKELYDFDKAALLINKLFLENQKFLQTLPGGELEAEVEGTQLEYIPVGLDYENVFDLIPEGIDVVISGPLRQLTYNQADELFKKFIEKGIPVFTTFDETYVKGYVLAGYSSRDFFPRISKRIALNIQSILLGENAGNLPVKFPVDQDFIINMDVAKKLKIYPSWSLMNNSTLINYQKEDVTRVLTLLDVITNALQFNLDYLTEKKRVESGVEDVNIARSYLLPQLNASATGSLVDKETAENSFGRISEKMIIGDLTLSQLIYDVDAWANYDINTLNQELIEYQLSQSKLDLIRDASTAYFNVLLARTLEKINRDNLDLSKSNMEIARYRVDVGSANLTEIYRWESEIANNLKSVIDANADKNLAEINLNRLLDLPSEETFSMDEDSLEQLISIVTGERTMKYYNNKWDFKIFRDFMVEEAFEYSPELKVIDKALEIQERISSAASGQFYLPTFGLQGQLSNVFLRSGAGSTIDPVTIPGVGDFQFGTIPKDFSWSVGLNLSLPLFEGLGRFAEVQQASIEIKKLQYEKSSLKNRIEQAVRSAVHKSGASYAGIEQAKISAESALKNLEIVRNLYSQGLASITDLIDAQSASLIAELLATNAQFNFLIDLMNVQRAAGEFIYTYSIDERDEFVQRLNNYYENHSK